MKMECMPIWTFLWNSFGVWLLRLIYSHINFLHLLQGGFKQKSLSNDAEAKRRIAFRYHDHLKRKPLSPHVAIVIFVLVSVATASTVTLDGRMGWLTGLLIRLSNDRYGDL